MTNIATESYLIMIFFARYLLAVASDGQPRTIFHSRIDGLLFPIIESRRGRFTLEFSEEK